MGHAILVVSFCNLEVKILVEIGKCKGWKSNEIKYSVPIFQNFRDSMVRGVGVRPPKVKKK